jgi:phosphoribosylformylglycinamidine synthase
MSAKPRTLVIRTAGTNCDAELCRAFEMAGSVVELVHVDALIAAPSRLDAFDLIGFPGGFSYGDDIASGRIMAMKLREKLYPALRNAAARGCLMIGVCNGFQTLVQCGLLPGPRAGESWPIEPPEQRCSLTDNAGGRFVDRWVGIEAPPSSVCIWTRGLSEVGENASERADLLQLPAAHGEGRFVCRTPADLAEFERTGQVALRYTDNYNGSENAIAGICDPSGRIFGLMPHPERYLDWTRHPYWTRLPATLKKGATPGAMFFRTAVEAAVGVNA